jgi:hypothetical protein
MNSSEAGLALLLVCSPLWGEVQAADPLRSSIELQSEIAQQATDSQAQIDRTYEATQQLLEEYQSTMRELDSSRRYNDHLDKMVRGQEEIIASLDGQLDEIDVTRREIVPLMDRMVDTLVRLVELDAPFLLEERRARVQHLQRSIDSPETSIAEKYRQIMEAYKIEAEYGGSVEAYRGTVAKGGGEQTVDFLRIGRVALLYRSLGGTQAAVWDQAARSWKELPDGTGASLERGFRVARKQAAPDLLTVPVSAPVVVP